jgi:hypothetical protein
MSIEIITRVWSEEEVEDKLARLKNRKKIKQDLGKPVKKINEQIASWEARLP